MKKIHKTIFLGIILLSLTLVVTACTSGETSSTIQYDLSLQVAGEGEIRNSAGNTLISSTNTTILDKKHFRNIDRDSTVKLNAVPATNNDFLFWAGDITNFSRANNSVYVDSNKDLIAVFGGDEVFMSGYITESNQTTNVTGYWKTTTEAGTETNPELEIYLNQRKLNKETYRYINNNDFTPGKVRAIRDGTGSKFIASIEKIEKSDDLDFGTEATRLLFVYGDFDGFRALVIPEDHPDINYINYEFTRIEGISNDADFIEAVQNLIQEYVNDDVIRGQTFILPVTE